MPKVSDYENLPPVQPIEETIAVIDEDHEWEKIGTIILDALSEERRKEGLRRQHIDIGGGDYPTLYL
jgi:hypothetical protein